ncbi:helix-turn-helix transcriptional regulator [Streptomyces mirabilis]|uniref:helix-turn-helix domain-containing protein n=1 Tax=Streptomyces mirabilis TaxID=68239 RepID=UPI0032E35BED
MRVPLKVSLPSRPALDYEPEHITISDRLCTTVHGSQLCPSVRVVCVPRPNQPDPQLHVFGMHVRRLREAQGLTLEELAERSGMSFRGVLYIEHGQRNPSLTTLLNLARGLKVSPSTLLAVFDASKAVDSE